MTSPSAQATTARGFEYGTSVTETRTPPFVDDTTRDARPGDDALDQVPGAARPVKLARVHEYIDGHRTIDTAQPLAHAPARDLLAARAAQGGMKDNATGHFSGLSAPCPPITNFVINPGRSPAGLAPYLLN